MPKRTCSVEGCDRPHYGKGLCNPHYLRQRRRGTTEPWQPPERAACSIEGCDQPEYAHQSGLCNKHNLRVRRHGDAGYERPDLRGPEHPSWKHDLIGYIGAHARVRRTRGKASQHACSSCGTVADDWAYDHADPEQQWDDCYGTPLAYSSDVTHYQPMCRSCHRKFDMEAGHDSRIHHVR